jgi:acylphosphatase
MSDSDSEAVRFFVSGHVQGVFFRKYTKREADRLALVGWVRNRRDGRVEALACGSRDHLAQFEQFLRTKGSPNSRIDSLERLPLAADDADALRVAALTSFEQSATV